ncbi:MAG: tetratricopeptide repeat protein [Myxococcales bacterium]
MKRHKHAYKLRKEPHADKPSSDPQPAAPVKVVADEPKPSVPTAAPAGPDVEAVAPEKAARVSLERTGVGPVVVQNRTERRGPQLVSSPAEKSVSADKELSEVRKEVIEARNLIIKNDNLLKNLHAELKAVAKRGDDQYKRTWIASGAAYAIFAVLGVAVSLFAVKASTASQQAQIDAAKAQFEAEKKRTDDLTAQLTRLREDAEQRKQLSARALDVFRLMTDGEGENRLKGVDEIAKLDRTRLTPLEQRALDARARALKNEIGQVAYERGKSAFRREDMKTAVTELKRFLALDPEGPDAIPAAFFLGAAHFHLRDYKDAVPYLERFTSNGKGQKNVDYAYLLLGQSHEQSGNYPRAAEVYQRGVAEFPASQFTPTMQKRMRIAQRGGVEAAAAPAAPAAPQ